MKEFIKKTALKFFYWWYNQPGSNTEQGWDKFIEKFPEYNIEDPIELLKESLEFMNKVPNKKYGDNYKICSKIGNFLKNIKS